jgi:hypothetical protein
MRRIIRDVILAAATLGLSGAAMVAGASVRLDWLAVSLILLWGIGHFYILEDD